MVKEGREWEEAGGQGREQAVRRGQVRSGQSEWHGQGLQKRTSKSRAGSFTPYTHLAPLHRGLWEAGHGRTHLNQPRDQCPPPTS